MPLTCGNIKNENTHFSDNPVIPAKAGIQTGTRFLLDTGLRRDDTKWFFVKI